MHLLLLLLALLVARAGTLTVDVLDVGQGDGILLRTAGGKAVLVDAGEGSADVVDQLRGLGVTELALAVASHPHADHIGGMNAVLLSIPAKLYVDNGLPHTTSTYNTLMRTVELRGIPYKTAAVGQVYSLDDDVKLTVLAPTATPVRGTRSDLNANSVVLRVTHGKDCMMLVGDAEAETEAGLLQRGLQPCEVLKVAHHGSEFASSEAFLAALKPKIAVISVGAGNTYGHPAAGALSRLSAAGAKVYRTDQDGGVRLESSGKGWKVSTHVSPGAAPAVGATVSAASTPAKAPAPAAGQREDVEHDSPAAAATPATAPAEAATDPTCAYVGSVSSTLFHGASCSTARRISPATRVCYASRADALAAGRSPAQDCKP